MGEPVFGQALFVSSLDDQTFLDLMNLRGVITEAG